MNVFREGSEFDPPRDYFNYIFAPVYPFFLFFVMVFFSPLESGASTDV